MISIAMVGDREIVARLSGYPRALLQRLETRVQSLTLRLQALVQQKLSGDVLRVVTGALRRSIQSDVTVGEMSVTGRVFSSGDVKYAAIHEFGGQTRAHIIRPVKAQALAFMLGGKMVFAREIHHPGSKMPERSFLRSSLTDMREVIVTELSQAAGESA